MELAAGELPDRVCGSGALRRRAWVLLGIGVVLLCIRTWVAVGGPLPIHDAALSAAVRQAKLAGWIADVTAAGFSREFLAAALLFEWAPALLFGAGLWLWARSGGRERGWLRRIVLAPAWAPCLLLFAVAGAINLFCFS